MESAGVDVLITAPQKGWSSTPSAGMVMLNAAARKRAEETKSSSFACDLGAWLQIMDAYEQGGHAYYATMPTDSLRSLRDTTIVLPAQFFPCRVDFFQNGPTFSFPDISLGVSSRY
jgi:aspartate aminotransferase-like enzyme